MHKYHQFVSLPEINEPFTCLAFSPDGLLLSAGTHECRTYIFQVKSKETVQIVVGGSAVTALLWHPTAPTLFIGFASGDTYVHHFSLMEPTNGPKLIPAPAIVPAGFRMPYDSKGPVESLAFDRNGRRLAVLTGPTAMLCVFKDTLFPEISSLGHPLPHPPARSETSTAEPLATSCHFIKSGSQLIVTYLEHGIICWDVESTVPSKEWHIPCKTQLGKATISPDDKTLVVANLYNGFDRFDLETRRVDYSYPRKLPRNIMLPVMFIHSGQDLAFGTGGSGEIRLCDVDDCIEQYLYHAAYPPGATIQSLAYGENNGKHYIAAGPSGPGPHYCVRVWESVPPKVPDAITPTTFRRYFNPLRGFPSSLKIFDLPPRMKRWAVLIIGITIGCAISALLVLIYIMSETLIIYVVWCIENLTSSMRSVWKQWIPNAMRFVLDVMKRLRALIWRTILVSARFVVGLHPGLTTFLREISEGDKVDEIIQTYEL